MSEQLFSPVVDMLVKETKGPCKFVCLACMDRFRLGLIRRPPWESPVPTFAQRPKNLELLGQVWWLSRNLAQEVAAETFGMSLLLLLTRPRH